MRRTIALITSLCLSLSMLVPAFAQGAKMTVSGAVTTPKGQAVLGASVIVKSAPSRGVIVDAAGNYSIQAAKGEILVYSCLGYETKEVTVSSPKIDVILQEDSQFIEETVIVGYSPMRKSDFTGSISSVKSSELVKTTATVGQALVGKVAGVEVRQSSGAPGKGVDIRVRGVSSLNGASPLYVVDGYPASEDVYINAQDIESIDILKDAASAAIYGSRAAAGVVLITTKRGNNADKASITYDFSYGMQSSAHKIDMLNAKEFAELHVDARNNSYRAFCNKAGVAYDPSDNNATRIAKVGKVGGSFSNVGLSPYYWDFSKGTYSDTAFRYDTDWQDEYFSKNAGIVHHSVSIKGGNEKIRYMASLGYINQDGIISPSNHKQITARLNLDAKVTKRLSVSANYSMYDARTRAVSAEGRNINDGATQCMLQSHPNVPCYNEDGTLAENYQLRMDTPAFYNEFFPKADGSLWTSSDCAFNIGDAQNPLAIARKIEKNTRAVRNNLTFAATYEFIPDLKLKAQIGRQWIMSRYTFYRPATLGVASYIPGFNDEKLESTYHYGYSDLDSNTDSLGEITLNWKKSFGNHNVDALGGFSAQKKDYDNIGMKAATYANDRIHDVAGAADVNAMQQRNMSRASWSMLSAFARLNYSYADRYTVTGTIRGDGCSRFGIDNKWGLFPSVSAGWTLSNEPFFKNNLGDATKIRFRASYGLSGNNNIGNYASIAKISSGITSFGNTSYNTNYEAGFVDSGLGWETTRQTNLGVDLGFFQGRLNFIANWYNSISQDILYSMPIPSISGSTTTKTNLADAKVRNRGFDAQIDARICEGEFNWTIGANISINRNKVLSLGAAGDEILTTTERSTQSHITRVGYPIGSFIAFRTMGIMNQSQYEAILLDREVYLANGGSFPADYKLKGPAVPSYDLEMLLPGCVIYNDLNGDKIIDNYDREILGDAYPDFTGGFSTSMSWKGFDLSAVFSFSYGAQVVNFNDYYIYNMEGSGNQYGIVRERYRSEEEPGNGFVPLAFAHGSKNTSMKMSDRYIDDASYLRLSNLTVGYTLPKSLTSKIKISSARVYLSGDNVFTLTNYRGFNPEVNEKSSALAPGFDWGSYPLARILTFGLSITF